MDTIVRESASNVHPSPVSALQQTPLHIAITCVGNLIITCDERLVITWPNWKARELLAYLATCDGNQAPRRVIQAALWPSITEQWATKGLLRTALWHVRRLLDRRGASSPQGSFSATCSIIVSVGDRLLLNPARCAVDYTGVRSLSASLLRFEQVGAETVVAPECASIETLARRWLTVAENYGRPICAGESFLWLHELAIRHRVWCLDAVSQAYRFAKAAGEDTLIAEALEKRLGLDPLHEPTLAALLRLRLSRNETAEVVARYRDFRQELAAHPAATDGVVPLPSAEVEMLYRAALSGAAAALPRGVSVDAFSSQHEQAPSIDCIASRYPPLARAPPEHRNN